MVGISAYRIGFAQPKAEMGRQATAIGRTGLWVLPNPSGLNANYQLPALAQAFGALRAIAFDAESSTNPSNLGHTKAPEGTADP